ncbi:hypothetical protein DFO67_1294 [Modicisalibacter xianhensis]|uniref:Uncharacterized protein n=1 Tax=Modicisalibacter xianhensis TaxID=442341 RepID=A0A4R8FJX1_9GAMM|nr:hypothetical protein [Halomonas xianhensis]TDX22471.1 hypothetical protein DFO67_1294 [Halomonas xianhensis]
MVKVEVNGMLYEDYHPDCKCIHSRTSSGSYAFIQVLDMETQMVKRYWGPFDIERPEASIESIMRTGGKWPPLPGPDERVDS